MRLTPTETYSNGDLLQWRLTPVEPFTRDVAILPERYDIGDAAMNTFAKWIFRLIKTISKGISLLILLMMAFVTFEVISRYVFNHPTSWVWLLNKQLFGLFVLVAGSYALIQKNHIRIEMLYDHFPPPAKTAIRWLTLFMSVGFLGILVWQSTLMGLEALSTRETANGVFRLPLYPLKMLMPIAALLFLLGCLTEFGKKE